MLKMFGDLTLVLSDDFLFKARLFSAFIELILVKMLSILHEL